jgi:CRP-like cAMP-binding protein
VHWPLLDSLSEDARRQLLALARRRRFTRNEIIFHEGDPGETLHLLERGHVAIRMHTPLGDVATARILRAGEFFGELAAVSPGPRNATAAALDPVETVAIDRVQLAVLRTDHGAVNELLLTAVVTEVRRLAQHLVEAMYLPSDRRLWRRMQDLTRIFGTDATPAATLPVTQDLIAQLTGCARATANRILRAGETDGLIEISRGHITIIDPDGIRRLAR